MARKPIEDMSFDEIVAEARGNIIVSIGDGSFKNAVWQACWHASQWERAQLAKEAAAKGKKP